MHIKPSSYPPNEILKPSFSSVFVFYYKYVCCIKRNVSLGIYRQHMPKSAYLRNQIAAFAVRLRII